MSRPQLAFAFVTDTGYALPTLVSAAAVRERFGRETADVYILTFGMDAAAQRELTQGAERRGIGVIALDPARSSRFDAELFADSYISMAAMGRFFIADTLPHSYSHIAYIDGDTWITPGLDQIAAALPPPGKMAGIEDPLISYSRRDLGPYGTWVRRYYRSLGLAPDTRYINSGVLFASSETWSAVSRDALDFYGKHAELCIHPDQSSLNAVLGPRLQLVSPRWNFTTQLMYYGVEAKVAPAIYHFTGPFKPWMGRFDPWSRISEAYAARLADFADVKLPLKSMTDSQAAEQTRLCRRYILMLQTLKRPRLMARRRTVREALAREAV